MNSQTIVMCVVALLLGMLLANMLKSVCGCKTVEGQDCGLHSTMQKGLEACRECRSGVSYDDRYVLVEGPAEYGGTQKISCNNMFAEAERQAAEAARRAADGGG